MTIDKTTDKETHFLVVDDDEDSRKLVVEYLQTMGHTKITQAENGASALKALEKYPSIGFVISDWDMPMMNGFTFLQKVRKQEDRANIPFMIMTSPISRENEKIMSAAEHLVDSYLIKPFRASALEKKVQEVQALSIHGPQKEVVLVDDDPDAREMTFEYLEKIGFRKVKAFEVATDALEYVRSKPDSISMILSDWEMPSMTGLEFLKTLKADPKLQHLPFLMMTSQGSMEKVKVVQAAQASVDQYLLKPFNGSELKNRVEELINKARHRAEIEEFCEKGADFLTTGNYQNARQCFDSALKLNPESDVALRGKGDVLKKLEGIDQAIAHYQKAIEHNSYSIKNYARLADAYEESSQIQKAISTLQDGMIHISFSGELHFMLGKLFQKSNMLALARKELEQAVELSPDHPKAAKLLKVVGDMEGNG